GDKIGLKTPSSHPFGLYPLISCSPLLTLYNPPLLGLQAVKKKCAPSITILLELHVITIYTWKSQCWEEGLLGSSHPEEL
ncbi:unnamed protein product, partial [Allacma fusca]